MKMVGVLRAKEMTRKPKADRAIMNAVAKRLRKFGHRIVLLDEKNVNGNLLLHQPEFIFSMARTQSALTMLMAFSNHIPMVNSPMIAAMSLDTFELQTLMETKGFPHPQTTVMVLNEISHCSFPYVLKSPDKYGKRRDTIIVDSPHKQKEAIEFFAENGEDKVLVQEFVQGEPRKFYGIGPEVFLTDGGATLSLEESGAIEDYSRRLGRDLMHLQIYGGEYIYTKDKGPVFTNLDDWPSFSPMRDEAAQKITDLFLSYLGQQSL